jgi:hypothetical protein
MLCVLVCLFLLMLLLVLPAALLAKVFGGRPPRLTQQVRHSA